MTTSIKADEEIFKELNQFYHGIKERIKSEKKGDKIENVKSGQIGDDFIKLDVDENEEWNKTKGTEIDEADKSMDKEGEEDKSVQEESERTKHVKRTTSFENETAGKREKVRPAPKLFEAKAPWLKPPESTRYGYLTCSAESDRKHFSERLHQEVLDFVEFLSPTKEEKMARRLLVNRVNRVVRKIFPDCRIELFGSFDTQLYLPTSDIDLVVVGGVSDKDDLVRPPLRKLAKALVISRITTGKDMHVISKARVPIIKFIDTKTNYNVDISFNISSGLGGARFLKHQLILYPALRPLTLIIKYFLDQRGLNEVFKGGLGSFSLVCLIISFFQIHPLIQTGYIKPEDNLGVMLMEFFELYGKNFNYEQIGVSVGLDLEFLNSTLNQTRSPSPFGTSIGYFDKMDRGWYSSAKPHLLSIQDPQNPENDLAKSSFSIVSVKQACEHAFDILSAAASELDSADYAASRGGRWSDLKRTDGSLLASLVSIPAKLIRHRQAIKQSHRVKLHSK